LRNHRQEVGEMRKLPTDYCLKLVDFLADWGTSLCISGGGDPSLHDGIPKVLNYAKEKGVQTSFVTNAIKISMELGESLMSCQWVAMSVDASNIKDYRKIKGVDKFADVCNNILNLTRLRDAVHSKVDLAFKMLVLEDNYTTIFDACKLAKELGVGTMQIRPCNYEREDIEGHKPLKIDIDVVKEQFIKCHEIETPEFKVFTTVHKYSDDFHVVQNFKRCLSTPLLLPLLTDGWVYCCVDHKLKSRFKMFNAYPDVNKIKEFWGSNEHRDFLKTINPKTLCHDVRCTTQKYNEQIEHTVINDECYLSFP
jgi:MoaA/NifB/PqqE/SkfB family radical SAM enzyme